MAPYWRAASQAPDGWAFTGNLSSSPDYMQYRVWMRQTQVDGPLVNNVFTSEPNRPYLPVSVYWAISTVTTVGFGDITPKTDLGRAIASLMMLLGYSMMRATASRCHCRPSQRSHPWPGT